MMNHIFVPDSLYVWLPAKITADDGQKVAATVEIPPESDPESCFESRIFAKTEALLFPVQASMPDDGSDNMCELECLNEATITENLKRRFFAELPYTYCNGICFAVNPYQQLNIYDAEIRSQYVGQPKSGLPAHVYSTSMRACHSLFAWGSNQSIVVSGESGAGKTETVKVLLNHIAEIAEPFERRQDSFSLFHKVLKASPLLESFGNAQTVRNDNSSRVGKFIQLDFDSSGKMLGSKCQALLLEKSRVTHQAARERNFHVFYEMLAAPEQWKEQVELKGKTSAHFRYTQGAASPTIISGDSDTLDTYLIDGGNHLATLAACAEVLHMSDSALQQLYSVLAAVLYLGQVCFPLNQHEVERDILPEELLTCAKLLGVGGAALAHALMCGVVDVQGCRIRKELEPAQAAVARDALAKEIYSRLFQWLVDSINRSTLHAAADNKQQQQQSDQPIGPIGSPLKAALITTSDCSNSISVIPAGVPLSSGSISLLDIFGFECFDKNAFEQLCINYANEKLQRKFAQDVIQSVQAEYAAEGVTYEPTPFRDNSAVLQLLEGRQGIFELLNEECVLPGGSEPAFLSKLRHIAPQHGCAGKDGAVKKEGPAATASAASEKGLLYVEHSSKATKFSVCHYAGSVCYEVEGFLAKNQDCVLPLASELLATSENPFLGELFKPAQSTSPAPGLGPSFSFSTQKSKQAGTIVSKFRAQLNSLMGSIETTQVQYVRCIKPNAVHSSSEFDRRLVVTQLRSGGLVEAVKVSRAAFPHKISHENFLQRYGCLGGKDSSGDIELSVLAQQLLMVSDGVKTDEPFFISVTTAEQFQVGTTKIFFGEGALQLLDRKLHAHRDTQAVCIQRCARKILCRARYLQVLAVVRVIQRAVRVRLARLQLRALLASRTALQRCFSQWVAAGEQLKKAALQVQTLVRRWRAANVYNRIRNSARKIQAAYLRYRQLRGSSFNNWAAVAAEGEQCSAQTQTHPVPPIVLCRAGRGGEGGGDGCVSLAEAATQTDPASSRRVPKNACRIVAAPTASAPTATASTQTAPSLPVQFLDAAAAFQRTLQELRCAFSCSSPRSVEDRYRLLLSAVLVAAAVGMAAHDYWWVHLSSADQTTAFDGLIKLLWLLVIMVIFRFKNSAVKGNFMMVTFVCAVSSVV